MKQFMLFVGVLAVVVLFGGCYIVGQRNALIALDENVNEAWSNIDADLQRRNDLIPNLVSTVKGYATHEEDVFTKIADARGKLAERARKVRGIHGPQSDVQRRDGAADGRFQRRIIYGKKQDTFFHGSILAEARGKGKSCRPLRSRI